MNTLDVLLVEDDPLDARQLELTLARAEATRFRVHRAHSVAEAETRLAETLPELIALDLSLPDAQGAETYERIRAAAPLVPVVVMTGRADDALALQLLEAGAQDYLLKSTLAAPDIARCFRYAVKRGEADRQLEEARRAAEEAARARSSFVAAMSHEIRTPLNAVLGLGDLLLDTPLREDQRQYVETLRRAGRGLLDLLNNVLELSRLESDAYELDYTAFDLRQLVEDATEMFGFSAHRKGIHLVAEIADEVPREVCGDGARLRQVLLNLIGNAVKFTQDGGVEVWLHYDGQHADIRVLDTGPGIPPQRLEHIFERFTQADSGVFSRHGGSGLGLSLARELCERMGGSLDVENRSEGGALFQARLPLPATETRPSNEPAGPRLAGMRVLVVEDDDVERHHYAGWLSRAGAEVIEAASAEAACERIAGSRLDAALLDSRMSGTGGIELAEAWRRRGDGPRRVVVALMTNHRAADVEHCEALGARHLLKPLRPAAVIEALAATEEPRGTSTAPPAPAMDFTGLRVLLAEDNPDNRDLVEAYLRGTGVALTCVEDGVEAAEERCRSEFDLVLMDVSMPRLDGHAAVRRIRQWERETGTAAVPIVILTAHASPEARQLSAEAGSQDHLVKPFDRAALHAVISRHGPPTRRHPPDCEDPDPLIADLVPEYLERRRNDVEQLERALAGDRFDEIRSLGHRMKGSGSGYGFPAITRLGERLEDAGVASDSSGARCATRELAALLARVAAADAARDQAPRAPGSGRSESR